MPNSKGEETGSSEQHDASAEKQSKPSLNKKELWDITFLVLAFSCVVATLTLIVGSGAMAILSVGGSQTVAPFSVAVVFIGMSFISLTATHWIFERWGRKIGFWVGCVLGLIGVLVGCWGLLKSSAAIVLVAQTIMGSGLGIGMYLRFSSVEVVRAEFSSRAVAWVLGGGCLAAFIGPETSQAAIGVFGDGNLTYLGPFVVAGGFMILQAACVGAVGFPSRMKETRASTTEIDDAAEKQGNERSIEVASKTGVWSIVRRPDFLYPLGISILSWIIMAMPMSIFRLTMGEFGFTGRQSLTVIEFHFLSMYSPGFWSGAFIKKYGFVRACQVGALLFTVALAIDLSTPANSKTTAPWFLGLILIGIGWNFGFSSATVWSTQAYQHALHLKSKIQAANDFAMFLISGAAIFSSGYFYHDAGGGGISGWRLLNGVLYSCVILYVILVYLAGRSLQRDQTGGTNRKIDESEDPTIVDVSSKLELTVSTEARPSGQDSKDSPVVLTSIDEVA